ncbi:MAG: polysaccharide biosynthesis/export family protein [Rhodospirillaceae bacterium]
MLCNIRRRLAWLLVLFIVADALMFWRTIAVGSYAATGNTQQVYKLGVGDKIKILVYGDDDVSGEFEVDSTGAISAKLIGHVTVQGLAVADVEKLLAETYRIKGYIKDPQVSIEIIYFRPFFILGEVEKRGSYPYVNGLTVVQAVAIAGGYTYRASKSRITIQRAGEPSGSEQIVEEDATVNPGDIIRVPERWF